ncbi:phenylalanine--tRNA ligase beta subunit-related protein [Actinopolymorpha sp. B9G3]|uniref:B3/B4 domain-containing protein n=1 Tax=Actinopolymorpha sp. B9G3 TaxID=3158970 RepID=UPI0032D8F778
MAKAYVEPAVHTLRPDYRALLVLAEGLVPGPSDDVSDRLLAAATAKARQRLGDGGVDGDLHVAAWREAFRSFGAKPKRTRSSVEALLRRLDDGLPRIDRLTDTYNAVSIAYAVPVGGEDIDHYEGPLRLVRATGEESFDTVDKGEPAVDHPNPGEVVWRDDAGVTCRRWNWRQCVRTRLTGTTTRAVFVLDALAPMDDDAVHAAGAALAEALRTTSPDVRLTSRLLAHVAT